MALSFKVIVIIILGIIVATAGIVFAFSVYSGTGKQAGGFWDFAGSSTKNASKTAEQQPSKVGLCKGTGDACVGSKNCCEGMICRFPFEAATSKMCLIPGGPGAYCLSKNDCESGLTCQLNAGTGERECT